MEQEFWRATLLDILEHPIAKIWHLENLGKRVAQSDYMHIYIHDTNMNESFIHEGIDI